MEKLAQSIFQGTRSGRALEGRWKAMKEKYDKAKVRINSTGEGEKSEEQWASMRRSKFFFLISKIPQNIHLYNIKIPELIFYLGGYSLVESRLSLL